MASKATSGSEKVRINNNEEIDLGEPPYIYSPYPDYIMLVHDPETRGERDVVQLIKNEWPARIDELEEASKEAFGDGYSGSFIRHVLRNFFAPQDMLHTVSGREADMPGSVNVESSASDNSPHRPEDDVWHRVFRLGIRTGLENQITEDDAFEAFGSGFVQGQQLKEEMEE